MFLSTCSGPINTLRGISSKFSTVNKLLFWGNLIVFDCHSLLQVMRGGDGKAGFLIRNPGGQVILPYQWQESAEHEDNSVATEG